MIEIKGFNLSKEIITIEQFGDKFNVLVPSSVKDFIRELKHFCYTKILFKNSEEYEKLIKEINKLAGEQLIK